MGPSKRGDGLQRVCTIARRDVLSTQKLAVETVFGEPVSVGLLATKFGNVRAA
jgi:hypothetical protein